MTVLNHTKSLIAAFCRLSKRIMRLTSSPTIPSRTAGVPLQPDQRIASPLLRAPRGGYSTDEARPQCL
jgi:hypothetical protein